MYMILTYQYISCIYWPLLETVHSATLWRYENFCWLFLKKIAWQSILKPNYGTMFSSSVTRAAFSCIVTELGHWSCPVHFSSKQIKMYQHDWFKTATLNIFAEIS